MDDQQVHSGRFSARIDRDASSANAFSTINAAIPVDFAGKTVEWRGWVSTENATDAAAIWMREDGDGPSTLAFATTQGLRFIGTNPWRQFSINIPAAGQARSLVVGFLLVGTGKAWVDDLELLVDGKPIAQADARVPTVFDSDREFDGNSRITLPTELSAVQVTNLAKLAKVWGFLKYHHPSVTSGKRHWDYDLFRVMPQVLAAADTSAANQAIAAWITTTLGASVPPCTVCATLSTDGIYLSPDLDALLNQVEADELTSILRNAYVNRIPVANNANGKQFFVSLSPGVGNPSFENEQTYPSQRFPDSGYQLLALSRFWNMVQYFYPNRDVMADDLASQPDYWSQVLEEFIPRIGLAKSSLAFQQELMQFIAKIHDTHANLWSSIGARPPMGACQLPVDIRFVEDKAYVIRHISATAGPDSGILPGDVIEQLDGVPVPDLVNTWRPIFAASNEPARLRDIGNYLTRGSCADPVSITVSRAGSEQPVNLQTRRVPQNTLDYSATYTHDLPGATMQSLADGEVAYLKLSSVETAKAAAYIEAAKGTKGLIIDIRNYPSEFVVFSLGALLLSERTDFVRFTSANLANPGAFYWTPRLGIIPQQPHYAGKIVILVDEVTQSQAEYTTMAFRTSPGAIVIGSTTAGADGNVSTVPLPGNLSSYISGIGVFYPDNRPTQRVGILPDIEVKPTIEGLRAGRDELIEEAIRQIKSAATPASSGRPLPRRPSNGSPALGSGR